MDAFRAEDYKKAFIMFATIVSATFPFPTEAITLAYNGQNYNAVTESQNKFKILASGLSYEPVNTSTQNVKDQQGSFVYTLTINGKPIEGMPVYCVNAGGRNIT